MTGCMHQLRQGRETLCQSVCCGRVQPSVSRWWFPSACQNLAELTSSLCSLELRSMVPITEMCCWCKSYCLWYETFKATSSSFSKMVRHHTGRARQSACYSRRRLHSFHQNCGLQTVQIVTPWTSKSGEKCSSVSTKPKLTTSMNWRSDWWPSETSWDKASSMMLLTNGANVCVHVFAQEEDTSSICFELWLVITLIASIHLLNSEHFVNN